MLLLCLTHTVYSALLLCFFFFFNDTATTEIYTLSLHDALPISPCVEELVWERQHDCTDCHLWAGLRRRIIRRRNRSEEHTSELQSRQYLVCRLLLEKKKKHST